MYQIHGTNTWLAVGESACSSVGRHVLRFLLECEFFPHHCVGISRQDRHVPHHSWQSQQSDLSMYLTRSLHIVVTVIVITNHIVVMTQPHLGCCQAAAVAVIFMHLCTNSATLYTSRQHMRSCNDVNGNCVNRRSRLTTAVAGHEKRTWASSSTGRSCIPKAEL
jgi:hypothetical protein